MSVMRNQNRKLHQRARARGLSLIELLVAVTIGGLLIGVVGTGPVFIAVGLIAMAAGLSGLLVRPLREA